MRRRSRRAVQRKASFLVATNVLDADQLSDQELIRTYKDQHSVERGFAFSKIRSSWPPRSS